MAGGRELLPLNVDSARSVRSEVVEVRRGSDDGPAPDTGEDHGSTREVGFRTGRGCVDQKMTCFFVERKLHLTCLF